MPNFIFFMLKVLQRRQGHCRDAVLLYYVCKIILNMLGDENAREPTLTDKSLYKSQEKNSNYVNII